VNAPRLDILTPDDVPSPWRDAWAGPALRVPTRNAVALRCSGPPLTLTHVTAMVSLALPIVPARAQAPASPATGNPTNGKKLYEAYTCYACHGFNGETGVRALASKVPSTGSC
jgi:mono/diheme cytochrome c family protein